MFVEISTERAKRKKKCLISGLCHEKKAQKEIKAHTKVDIKWEGRILISKKWKLKKCQLNKIHFKRLLLIELKFNLATFRNVVKKGDVE